MTVLFFVLLLLIGLGGVGVYLAFFLREVPGAAEQRLGTLEPLPEDVGKWKTDDGSPEAQRAQADGLRREVRFWFDANGGLLNDGKLLRQVRYRSAVSGEIVRVDPDEVVKRKRIKH